PPGKHIRKCRRGIASKFAQTAAKGPKNRRMSWPTSRAVARNAAELAELNGCQPATMEWPSIWSLTSYKNRHNALKLVKGRCHVIQLFTTARSAADSKSACCLCLSARPTRSRLWRHRLGNRLGYLTYIQRSAVRRLHALGYQRVFATSRRRLA